MKKSLGYTLLSLPFIGTFAIFAFQYGVWPALGCFTGVGVVLLVITAGCYLIDDGVGM